MKYNMVVVIVLVSFMVGCEKEVLQPQETFVLSGSIKSVSGETVSNAVVRVNALLDTTDTDGNWIFDSVPEGSGRLTVEHPDYANLDTLLTIDSDTYLDLVLRSLPDTMHVVTGALVSNWYRKISGATVTIGTQSVTTDQNGAFSLAVADGTYRCTVAHPVYTAVDTILAIHDDTNLDFKLDVAVVTDGRVNIFWENTYYPIVGARVDGAGVYSGGHYYVVETDSSGYFRIPDGGVFQVSHTLGNFTNDHFATGGLACIGGSEIQSYTVTLQTLLDEYLPLNIGNEWVYAYSYYRIIELNRLYVRRAGTITVHIVDSENVLGQTVYHCLSVFHGTQTDTDLYKYPDIDTIIEVDADTTYFDILQSGNDIFIDENAFGFSADNHPIACKQGYPYIFPDTVEFNIYPRGFALKKYTGISDYHYEYIANHHITIHAELISYSLQ